MDVAKGNDREIALGNGNFSSIVEMHLTVHPLLGNNAGLSLIINTLAHCSLRQGEN